MNKRFTLVYFQNRVIDERQLLQNLHKIYFKPLLYHNIYNVYTAKIQNIKKDALPKTQGLVIFYSEEGDVSDLNFKAFSNKFFLYVSGIWLVIYRNLFCVFFNMPHPSLLINLMKWMC